MSGCDSAFVDETTMTRVKKFAVSQLFNYTRWVERRRYARIKKMLARYVQDNPMIRFAERELGDRDGKEGPDLWMYDHVMAMMRLWCLEHHSGASAAISRSILHELLDNKPLSPLTGNPDEWSAHAMLEAGRLQNTRCSGVFRDVNTGIDSYQHGFVFREPWVDSDGKEYTATYESVHSERVIKLPCHPPETVVLDVPRDATGEQQMEAILAAGFKREDVAAFVRG